MSMHTMDVWFATNLDGLVCTHFMDNVLRILLIFRGVGDCKW